MNGRVIGSRYELSALLGQGGMGQVWIGYDRRLDRRVAVKLLRPDQVAGSTHGEEMRRRFVRECRVTAQVDHPGLVTVHDAGNDGEDLYLVMQYVAGADLSDHLAEHDPYPWQWTVAVATQLCAVLGAVHAVPIVHRDLKPRNVMIRPDGTLVVLDLGIASALGTDTTRLTRTGSPVGSPAYMAPEQAMGAAVSPSTDLYALGVLLYELLCGQVPFAGSTALGVLHRHLHEEPVPLRTLRSDVPEVLEALVLRLLRKEPEARPANAQEVYLALVPLLPTPEDPHAGEVRSAAAGSHSGPAPLGAPPTPASHWGIAPMDPTRPFRQPHAPWPVHVPDVPTTAPGGPAGPAAPPAAEPARPVDDFAAVSARWPAARSPAAHSVAARSPADPRIAATPSTGPAATPAAAPAVSSPAASGVSRPGPWTAAATPVLSAADAAPPASDAVPGFAPGLASGPAPGPRPHASSAATPGPDVAAAVEEVKRLLDQGRVTRAVDVLGGILPAAAERHGARSPVVRSLRKQYAATLMDNGEYRRALPELRLLAEEFAKESGPGAARQALQFRYEAAQCLEQLGEVAHALAEYRILLPHFERYPDDPLRPLEIRRSVGHLLLAQGDHIAAQQTLRRLLQDAEHLLDPQHAFRADLRHTLHWLSQVRG